MLIKVKIENVEAVVEVKETTEPHPMGLAATIVKSNPERLDGATQDMVKIAAINHFRGNVLTGIGSCEEVKEGNPEVAPENPPVVNNPTEQEPT